MRERPRSAEAIGIAEAIVRVVSTRTAVKGASDLPTVTELVTSGENRAWTSSWRLTGLCSKLSHFHCWVCAEGASDLLIIERCRQTDTAAALGIHPKTVSRVLKRDTLLPIPRAPHAINLDPFKPAIDRLLDKNVWNTVVIVREIQARGILRAYVSPRLVQRCATMRFETPPAANCKVTGVD